MNPYRSVFSDAIEKFVGYRRAAGSWNNGYAVNIRLFDHFCADNYPGMPLCQEMVDSWCRKRETENNRSCYTRILVIRAFISYLHGRSLTDIIPPKPPKREKTKYVPHYFSHDELVRFFHECDSIVAYKGRPDCMHRKITVPVFFRLLYSSGIRTTEARLLYREDVDLHHGILNIRQSKGYDQHYVALHQSMTELLMRYDNAADKLQPNRTYFFESLMGKCYSHYWVIDNFNLLWNRANGDNAHATAYDLRHNYASANINSWEGDTFGFSDRLLYLSKSMGHRFTKSILYYYSIVPGMADTIHEKTETGFNSIIPDPEVAYEEE